MSTRWRIYTVAGSSSDNRVYTFIVHPNMENLQRSPALADLLTILYRPRETMRRILDGGGDRWAVQVVLLAFFCASVNDADPRHIREAFPGVSLLAVISIVAFVLVVGAATWVLALFVLSWIAVLVGRMMAGVGTVADVRAALGWGMVPIIWSVIYRMPIAVLRSRFDVHADVKKIVLDFIAHGGCSIIVIALALQIIFLLWSIVVGSCCLAEAQRFSTERGFVNLAISIALPVLVIGVAMFTFRT